jgi:hypothetical protein
MNPFETLMEMQSCTTVFSRVISPVPFEESAFVVHTIRSFHNAGFLCFRDYFHTISENERNDYQISEKTAFLENFPEYYCGGISALFGVRRTSPFARKNFHVRNNDWK